MNRYKARIRTYPPHSNHVWLEVKARSGDSMYKTRACVPMSDWEALVKNPTEDRYHRFPFKTARCWSASRIMFTSTDSSPMYSSSITERLISATWMIMPCHLRPRYPKPRPDEMVNRGPHRICGGRGPPGADTPKDPMCVVELKFGAMVPRWMNVLIQNFELIRYSFSKSATVSTPKRYFQEVTSPACNRGFNRMDVLNNLSRPDIVDWRTALISITLAFALAQAVAFVYMRTFRGLSYSRRSYKVWRSPPLSRAC